MGAVRGFSIGGAALAVALALAAPAAAQFSDSYNLVKAVREADGTKAMEILNKPGAPSLNARDPKNGESLAHIVVKRHDQTWLAFLLSRGAPVDGRDNFGDTPLITAMLTSDSDAARILLQYGAKVNGPNSGGETPLIIAVQRRDLASIRLLIANGADPKIADHVTGKTAREYAADDPRGTAILKVLDEAKPKPVVTMGPVRN
jgi:ankyrin repeat protein